jgi:hypothetical protein
MAASTNSASICSGSEPPTSSMSPAARRMSEIATAGTIFGLAPGLDMNGNPIAIPANTVFGQHAGRECICIIVHTILANTAGHFLF